MQGKDSKGLWQSKGEGIRKVRSIRATDATWEKLNEKAAADGMTAADWIEKIALGECTSKDSTDSLEKAIALLEAALPLPPNKGGAIKAEIRKALQILSEHV